MGEHLIAKNGVRNLRSMNQVEFQKTSLQCPCSVAKQRAVIFPQTSSPFRSSIFFRKIIYASLLSSLREKVPEHSPGSKSHEPAHFVLSNFL
jgi:hypothetical protein